MLLKRQPTLFAMKPSNLRERVHRVMEMGFSADSRMLVHALYTVSCMSQATLERKFNLFQSFGFSKDECMSMFRRNPGLFRTSEEKLKLGLEFYLYTVGFERKVLVYQPTFLMNSLEKRVIPRYRVLSILKSKKLLKKNPSFAQVLLLSDEVFKEKFIAMFINDAEELLIAYKGESSDSSDE
uniref:Transcription termination factor MTEF1, chloroplastic-like n=1 Tax=Nelumbo nucifera TaxID=4432 RepID=A0A822Z557_NELNU|nr:TPA_asm: hypothetical protein HUJ06_014535 [Nelumbo nucifera]